MAFSALIDGNINSHLGGVTNTAGIVEYNGNLYQPTIHEDTLDHDIARINVYKSIDNGASWSFLTLGPLILNEPVTGIVRARARFTYVQNNNELWIFYPSATATHSGSGFAGVLTAVKLDLATETFGGEINSNFLPFIHYQDTGTLVWSRSDFAWNLKAIKRDDGTFFLGFRGQSYFDSAILIISHSYCCIFNGVTFSSLTRISPSNLEGYQWITLAPGVGNNRVHALVMKTQVANTSPSDIYYSRIDSSLTFSFQFLTTNSPLGPDGTGDYSYTQDGVFYLSFLKRATEPAFDFIQVYFGNDVDAPSLLALSVSGNSYPAADIPSLNDSLFGGVFRIGGCWCAIVIKPFGTTHHKIYRSVRTSGGVWTTFTEILSVAKLPGTVLSSSNFSMSHSGNYARAVFGGRLPSTEPNLNLDSPGVYFAGELEIVADSSCGAPTVNVGDSMNLRDFLQISLIIVGGGIPPIVIDICPDIVASSACAEVKTISDDEPILTNCEESVFSESALICE